VTDDSGTVVFRSVSLPAQPMCVLLSSVVYAAQEPTYAFASKDAPHVGIGDYKVLTDLPSEVTFHVDRRSFGDQLRLLFVVPSDV